MFNFKRLFNVFRFSSSSTSTKGRSSKNAKKLGFFSLVKERVLLAFGLVYMVVLQKPFNIAKLIGAKIGDKYMLLTRIPLVGRLFMLPINVFNIATFRHASFPVFPNSADLSAYMVKLRQDNIKTKGMLTMSLLFVVYLISTVPGTESIMPSVSPYVAKVRIEGVISEEAFGGEEFSKMMAKISKDKKVAAVIVEISSPGGGVYTSEALYDTFKELSEHKPTVALIKQLGASGGYMAAIGCDKIFASSSSIVGSIGVLTRNIEYTDLAEKLGIKLEIYKSTMLKASPNSIEKTSPEVKLLVEERIKELFRAFKERVKRERKLTDQEADKVATGEVFTGTMALQLKLVDKIGREKDVLKMWKDAGTISKNAEVREVTPEPRKKKNRDNVMVLASKYIMRSLNNALIDTIRNSPNSIGVDNNGVDEAILRN